MFVFRRLYSTISRYKTRVNTREKRLLASSCFSVCPSASVNAAAIGQIYVRFYVGDYCYENPFKKFQNFVKIEQIYRVVRYDCRGFNNLPVWNELDYRVDVCRITKGAHIEHL